MAIAPTLLRPEVPLSHPPLSVYDPAKPLFYGVDESGGFSAPAQTAERLYIAACVANSRVNGSTPPLSKRRPDTINPSVPPTKLDFRYTYITAEDIEKVREHVAELGIRNTNPQMATRSIATCGLLVNGFGYSGNGNVIVDVFGADTGKAFYDITTLMLTMHGIPMVDGLKVESDADRWYYPVNEADAAARFFWRLRDHPEILFPEHYVPFSANL